MNRPGCKSSVGWSAVLISTFIISFWALGGVPDAIGGFNCVSIPFDFDPLTQPKIGIETRVNGSRPRWCFFDTGSNLSLLLSASAANELALATNTDTVLVEPGSLECRKARVQNLVLGGRVEISLGVGFVAPPGDAQGAVWDRQFAGVLGVALFAEKCCVQFDFDSREMKVFPSTNKPPGISGASEVVLRHAGRLRYFVPVSFGDAGPVEVLVDTGAANTRLPATMSSALEGLPKCRQLGHSRDGALEMTEIFLLPQLRIGGITVTNVEVEIAPSNATPVLGLELLSRFRVTLDFPNEQMLLERRLCADQQVWLRGDSGARISQAGTSFRLLETLPGSAALESGLIAGDEIRSIGSRCLAGLSLWQVHRLFNGFEDKAVEVEVARSGQNLRLRLTPKRLFNQEEPASSQPRPARGRLGMELSQGAGGRLFVIQVHPDSLAENAGIRIGDEVVEVNDRSVSDTSLSVLTAETKKENICFKLRRQGTTLAVQIAPTPRQRFDPLRRSEE